MREEDRNFVYHVLLWIAHHNELSGGNGIGCSILIEAAEASLFRLTNIKNELFYDDDTLREVCGCLVNISAPDLCLALEDPCYTRVGFAHYSVREYLDSRRPSNAPLSIHNIIGGNHKDWLLETILREVQDVKLVELWELEFESRDSSDFYRVANSNFHFYCAISAFISLPELASGMYQQDTLKALIFDLLDPSMPHYSSLKSMALLIDHNMDLFSYLDQTSFWMAHWHIDTDDAIIHLYNILLLNENHEGFEPLAKMFLQNKNLKGLLEARVYLEKYVWMVSDHDDNEKSYTLKGSLIEIYAQLSKVSVTNFKLLIEVGAGLFDPSTALLLYISAHRHSIDYDCRGFCPLQRLLNLGADPNLSGAWVTPLQIATLADDLDGVEKLLKAGALPNETGDVEEMPWEQDSLMCHVNEVHGFSPLTICRNFCHFLTNYGRDQEKHNRIEIEELLLRHGAEAT